MKQEKKKMPQQEEFMFFIGQIPFDKTATYKGDDDNFDKIEDEELRKFKIKKQEEKIQSKLSRQ